MSAEHGVQAQVIPSAARALETALQQSQAEDVVLACGSLFVVAEARAAWAERGGTLLAAPRPQLYALKASREMLERGE